MQGNKVNAKNNPEAYFPANVQKHTHTHAHTHAHTHHCPGLMLQKPNQSRQLPENMTWPFRFTEHQPWVGLACFPFQRTLCPSRPLRRPQGLNPPQIITLGEVCSPQDRAKKTWLWSWPILRVLWLLNHTSQGFYHMNNAVTIDRKWGRSGSCVYIPVLIYVVPLKCPQLNLFNKNVNR